jgi:hypothetical protein
MRQANRFLQTVTVISIAAFLASCATRAQDNGAGSPAPASAAMYEMEISPGTRYVNVKLNDVVTFVAGGNKFTWYFNDPKYWPVDLNRIAPAGTFDHPVTAYVSPFRRYFGREDTSGER